LLEHSEGVATALACMQARGSTVLADVDGHSIPKCSRQLTLEMQVAIHF
jgi:hypothetical protein